MIDMPMEAYDELDRLRWGWTGGEDAPAHPGGRIAIVGFPGAGKKTLCNSLWGWQVLDASRPHQAVRDFGLLTLIDLPGDGLDASEVLFQLQGADLVMYLLDGAQGLRPEDFQWIARLRAMDAALMVLLGKADQWADVPGALAQLSEKLGMPALAVNAKDRDAVQREIIPAMVKACPSIETPLASQVAGIRRRAAMKMIVRSAILSGIVSLEPVPALDVSVLVGMQAHLLRRIAQVYGYQRGAARQDIAVSAAAGLALRFTTQTAAKLVPVAGWLASGVIGASATWAVGRAAMAYYGDELPHMRGWLADQWKRVRGVRPLRRR